MRKLRDVFLDLLLRYLITDPIAKLPTILSLVEKLEKGHIYEAEIRAARKLWQTRLGSGASLRSVCSTKSTGTRCRRWSKA